MVRPLITVDTESPVPLYQQLITTLEEAIARGAFDELPLPSTRRLAEDLGVSRNTVLSAYDALMSQGLIEAVPRKGLYVAPDAVVRLRVSRHSAKDEQPRHDWKASLSGRTPLSHIVKERNWAEYPYPFLTGQPDPSLFPVGAWERALREALRPAVLTDVLQDAQWRDDPLLVQMICEEIAPARGVRAEPDQVMVTMGSQHALHLLSLVLVAQGSIVAVEDPGYLDARNIFSLSGAALRAVPVDADGVVVDSLAGVDLLYVTPSHQYPTTATLPLRRRERLLGLAAETGTIIVEDDYDTELVFRGTPTAAIKALDSGDRVVYLGSFSKMLAPGLRLGYVVGAPELIAAMRERARYTVRHPPGQLQRALALLIQSRDYARHVRRIRKHYRRRWETVCAAVDKHFTWAPQRLPRGGFALWIEGPEGMDSGKMYDAARRRGALVEPGAVCFVDEPRPSHFFRLGYQAVPEPNLEPGIAAVAKAVAATLESTGT